jgi:hypothetical protein
MQETPEQLVDPHGIESLGAGISDALVALVAQLAAFPDRIGQGAAFQEIPDLFLGLLVGNLNSSMGERRAHGGTKSARGAIPDKTSLF